MRFHVPLLMFCCVSVCVPPWPVLAAGPEDSIVRVTSRIRMPNPLRPWVRQAPIEIGGTGVVLAGGRILTNAHLVTYADEVTLQGSRGGDRATAKIVAVGSPIDLALLVPDDPEFLKGRKPMPRASVLPPSGSPIILLGFAVGGRGLSTTQGVVSRTEYGFYPGGGEGLSLQVDATAAPGNSGGPGLTGDRMVGLTFGSLGKGSSFLVPNEEIDAFLHDVTDGRYDGPLTLRDGFQVLENPALRARLGLDASPVTHGVMVIPSSRPPAESPLRAFDVVTKIGDHPVDDEGMVDGPGGNRLSFAYYVPRLARDGAVPLTVRRDGRECQVKVPVSSQPEPRLAPSLDGGRPRWFLCGPLVFSPLVAEAIPIYVRMNPGLSDRRGSWVYRCNQAPEHVDEELVIVTSPLLPHKVAKGYEEPIGQTLAEVDGQPVRNLAHLVRLIRDGQSEFVTFRFAEEATEHLVFRRKELAAATREVMAENGIPAIGSDDVVALWGKPGKRP